MNHYFYDMGMPRRIPPGESRSGFVFTHARPGTKAFNVDLFGASRDNDVSFTFFIDVPGFAPDHSEVYFDELYSAGQIRELDRAELRSELATMDLFTRDRSGQQPGAPINVIVVGEAQEVLQALIRANWIETTRTAAELAATAAYFFDRPADVVFTTNRDASGERNELQFWSSPMRTEGVPVWFAQVTHHIRQRKGRTQLDPDLDDAATFFVQDIWYGQGLARYGWVKGQGEVTFEDSRRTFAGAEYFTSGNLAVTWLTGETVSMLDVDKLGWDVGPVRAGP